MHALIVESPSKSKTISKYLGKGFKILSSFGHVRALPTKKGSVDTEQDFKMIYELTEQGKKIVPDIVKQLKDVKTLYLATDPDREGEAISWHLMEVLKQKKSLPPKVHRVVFNEITKSAVQNAIKNPREVNLDLVKAQRLRQALDYLVGFNLSPILWKKLPGSKSAGRVQSVALRILCDREYAIDIFKPEEYWNLFLTLFSKKDDQSDGSGNSDEGSGGVIEVELTHAYQKKLEKTDIKSKDQMDSIVQDISCQNFKINEVKKRSIKKKPPAPFITSTLQQSASTSLGFAAKKTMYVAQQLYEGIEIATGSQGLITYMRTDGLYIAKEAVNAIRKLVLQSFGDKYLPKNPPEFKKKVQNAQEAHESIRPTDISITPDSIKQYLSNDQYRLYKIIWERAMACQMTDAVINSQNISFVSDDGRFITSASCSELEFDGFYRVYSYSKEKIKNSKVAEFINSASQDDIFAAKDIKPEQNFTEPPKRYSEAGLIKKMEELGIGRPSTYATIISVLQDRFYATIKEKSFVPESRGRVVSAFLNSFFSQYIEYTFTADLENQLDKVAEGSLNWMDVIQDFWQRFYANVQSVDKVEIQEILKSVNDIVKDQAIIKSETKIGDICQKCKSGQFLLNIGRFGVFLSCSNYPDCKNTISEGGQNQDAEEFPKQINAEITLNKGPYGLYLKYNEKNFSAPKGTNIEDINEDFAKKITSLPKVLGVHPSDQKEIKLGLGPYGLYLLYNKNYTNIPIENIGLVDVDEAIKLIEESKTKGSGLVKVLGQKDEEEVQIKSGRYGDYIKFGKLNVAIPKNLNAESITLEDAILLIQKKQDSPVKKTKPKARISGKKA